MSIQIGSRGSEVLSLQKMLRAVGYTTTEDGIFGSDTKAAVLHFQSTHGLKLDGVVGPQTMAYLKSIITGEPVAPVKSKASITTEFPTVTGIDYTTYIKYAAIGLIGIIVLSTVLKDKK